MTKEELAYLIGESILLEAEDAATVGYVYAEQAVQIDIGMENGTGFTVTVVGKEKTYTQKGLPAPKSF